MEQQIFVAGFIGFFSVLLITAPIYRAYLTEKKENDSRKEQERFERYCRKRGFGDENIGHLVKDRSKISDVGQGNRPKFTCMYDRIMWDLENSPSPQQAGENAL